jgi:hypothetical protein
MVAVTRSSRLSEKECSRTLSVPVCSKAKQAKLAKRWLSRSLDVKNQCLSLLYRCEALAHSDHRYRAGLKEVQILNKLKQADPDDKKHIVRLERTFEHRGHLCMVFESLRSAFWLFALR